MVSQGGVAVVQASEDVSLAQGRGSDWGGHGD